MVSHDPAEVLSMADELIVLKDGEVMEMGSPKELYNHPQHLYTARLLSSCNILTRQEATACGIHAAKEHVVVYPEWARATSSWTHKDWTIKQVLFKGSHEGLVVEKDGVLLRLINDQSGKYGEDDKVHVKVERFLEF